MKLLRRLVAPKPLTAPPLYVNARGALQLGAYVIPPPACGAPPPRLRPPGSSSATQGDALRNLWAEQMANQGMRGYQQQFYGPLPFTPLSQATSFGNALSQAIGLGFQQWR